MQLTLIYLATALPVVLLLCSSWLKKDPLPESLVSGTSCYDSIDNDFDNIIDSNEKECLM